MLYSIVLFIFVIICLLLVGIILLQTSQTGGMGSIGGGNSYLEGALGGQGADSLLLRTTTIFAVIFMATRDIVIAFVVTGLFVLLILETIPEPPKEDGEEGGSSFAKKELEKEIDKLKVIKDSL